MNTTMMWFLTSLTATFQADPGLVQRLVPSVETCQGYAQIDQDLSPRMKQAFQIRCPGLVKDFQSLLALAEQPAAN